MKAEEFGNENSSVIILLHGGGLSPWSYREAANILAQKYHVVVPVLNGHANSDRDFVSIEDSAAEICDYIKTRFGGRVFAIGGLSLGGQILTEMLSRVPDICRYAVIESALVIPMKMTNRLVRPMIKMSYGLIKKQWFAKLQFKQLRIKADLYEEYYNDTCKITMDNMIAFLESNSAYALKDSLKNTSASVIIAVGEKENNEMKQSAELLHQTVPKSRLLLFPDYYHGELSINHAKEYAGLFESFGE